MHTVVTWQVLAEYDGSNNLQRKFIYGNGTESPQWRIDEVLLMIAGENDYYYAHDHLYSPAALIDSSGTVLERCEYDAYGNCSILEPNFAPDPDGKSDYENPYLFTGRRLDIMDNSSLKIQYNRNRYYDYYTGRWLSHDPSGYVDGMNLYEYVRGNPANSFDALGNATTSSSCPDCSYGDNNWRREQWPRLKPRPKPGEWVDFGGTDKCSKCMRAELEIYRVGACFKLKLKTCKCRIRGWYYYPALSWMRDTIGNNPKQHERGPGLGGRSHREIIERSWNLVQWQVPIEVGRLRMCKYEALCYKRAFDKYVTYALKECHADNMEFDCDAYPPGPAKKRVCRRKDRARNAANKAFLEWDKLNNFCMEKYGPHYPRW